MQAVDSVAPASFEHHLIPLRDEVVDGAPRVGLAERSAAVHAARRLHSSLDLLVALGVDLSPVEHALEGVAVRVGVAVVIDEPPGLVDFSKCAVTALDLRRVIGASLVAPDLVVLTHGEASMLLMLMLPLRLGRHSLCCGPRGHAGPYRFSDRASYRRQHRNMCSTTCAPSSRLTELMLLLLSCCSIQESTGLARARSRGVCPSS